MGGQVSSDRPVVFLHGTAGGPGLWAPIAEAWGRPVQTLTLPGHGGRPPPVDWDQALTQLEAELPERPWLVGYSLGGRLALGLLAEARRPYAGAMLIGVHPGLPDPGARAERRREDQAWAERLRQEGLTGFFAAWDQRPVLSGRQALPSQLRARLEADRQRHRPEALAAALEAYSLGAMPDYGPRLAQIQVPVALIVGAEDAKFAALAAGMLAQLPSAELHRVAGVGHRVPEEAPGALLERLKALVG